MAILGRLNTENNVTSFLSANLRLSEPMTVSRLAEPLICQYQFIYVDFHEKGFSMTFYRRNLPHWQPKGATYFITFILAGSLPGKALEKIRHQRTLLEHLDDKGLNNEDLKRQRIIHESIFKSMRS